MAEKKLISAEQFMAELRADEIPANATLSTIEIAARTYLSAETIRQAMKNGWLKYTVVNHLLCSTKGYASWHYSSHHSSAKDICAWLNSGGHARRFGEIRRKPKQLPTFTERFQSKSSNTTHRSKRQKEKHPVEAAIIKALVSTGAATARVIESHPDVVAACRSTKTKARRHLEAMAKAGRIKCDFSAQAPRYWA